jgi:starch synthase
MEGVEYYGQIGFLKSGLALADHVTTVSPTYALEIQDSEMGMGSTDCCAIVAKP